MKTLNYLIPKVAMIVLFLATVVASRPIQAKLTAEKALTIQCPSVVYSLAFSPDDHTLAGGRLGTVLLWNGRGEVTKTLLGIEGNVTGVSFSPDGKTLAAVSDGAGKNFGLWSLETGEIKAAVESGLPRPFDSARNILFSRDGKQVAVSGNSFLMLLNADTGAIEKRLDGHKLPIQALYFSSRSGSLISVAASPKKRGAELFAWDVATGQVQSSSELPDVETPLTISANGYLAALKKRQYNFWNVENFEPLGQAIYYDNGNMLCLSPTAHYFAEGATIRLTLWLSDGSQYTKLHAGDVPSTKAPAVHDKPLTAMAFSSSGLLLATAGFDSTVKVWPVQE